MGRVKDLLPGPSTRREKEPRPPLSTSAGAWALLAPGSEGAFAPPPAGPAGSEPPFTLYRECALRPVLNLPVLRVIRWFLNYNQESQQITTVVWKHNQGVIVKFLNGKEKILQINPAGSTPGVSAFLGTLPLPTPGSSAAPPASPIPCCDLPREAGACHCSCGLRDSLGRRRLLEGRRSLQHFGAPGSCLLRRPCPNTGPSLSLSALGVCSQGPASGFGEHSGPRSPQSPPRFQ